MPVEAEQGAQRGRAPRQRSGRDHPPRGQLSGSSASAVAADHSPTSPRGVVFGGVTSNAAEDERAASGGFDPVDVSEESVAACAAEPTVDDVCDLRAGGDASGPRARRATRRDIELGEREELVLATHHATDGAGRDGGRHRVSH